MQFNKENKLSQSQTDFWNLFANSQFDFFFALLKFGVLKLLDWTGIHWTLLDDT